MLQLPHIPRPSIPLQVRDHPARLTSAPDAADAEHIARQNAPPTPVCPLVAAAAAEALSVKTLRAVEQVFAERALLDGLPQSRGWSPR